MDLRLNESLGLYVLYRRTNFYDGSSWEQTKKKKKIGVGYETAITNTYVYNITCKVCEVVRTALVTAFVAIVALEEVRLERLHTNLHQWDWEAKALMLQKTEETKYDV